MDLRSYIPGLVLAVSFATFSSIVAYPQCDTIQRPTITVIQPVELQRLLDKQESHERIPVKTEKEVSHDVESSTREVSRMAGYRVQVFSDNNQRTAKGEARSKEKLMKEAFPEYSTYIVFNSPFWRLKVGDFKTQHEAEAAADEMRSRFPSFAREIRIIKDRIVVKH